VQVAGDPAPGVAGSRPTLPSPRKRGEGSGTGRALRWCSLSPRSGGRVGVGGRAGRALRWCSLSPRSGGTVGVGGRVGRAPGDHSEQQRADVVTAAHQEPNSPPCEPIPGRRSRPGRPGVFQRQVTRRSGRWSTSADSVDGKLPPRPSGELGQPGTAEALASGTV
jgi:hypothetical protein